MRKLNKIYLTLLLTFISLFTSISVPISALPKVYIVSDSDNLTSLPQHFRKTNDILNISALGTVNTKGLDRLNISGSGQFTAFNLPLLLETINNNILIIDIDLREESHGFINGIPISFANSNNSANKGLILDEVLDKESEDLFSLKLGTPLTIYNLDYTENKTLTPEYIKNEYTLVTSNNIFYLRIPITDFNLPNEDMVNYFVDFVKNQPKNSWLHFHCKAGIGRTTTFMIMYDILKNYNDVSLKDIITRQVLIANIPPKYSIDFFIGNRYKFLNDFYNKCKNNKFNISPLVSINNDIFPYKKEPLSWLFLY